MIFKNIDELAKQVGGSLRLTTLIISRARQIIRKSPVLVVADPDDPVRIAFLELMQSKIKLREGGGARPASASIVCEAAPSVMPCRVTSALAIQSPAVGRQPWLAEAIARAGTQPRRVAIDAGLYEEWLLPGARSLRAAYQSKGVALRYREVPDGHSWGHWRATAAEMLEFLYGPP